MAHPSRFCGKAKPQVFSYANLKDVVIRDEVIVLPDADVSEPDLI